MALMVAFAPLFSKPVFQHAQVLLCGAILAPGKRTVTAALSVMGLSRERHFQNYHRVLNCARWSGLTAARVLLSLLVDAFAPAGALVLGLDDTIERRRGEQIAALGIYRDPQQKFSTQALLSTGLEAEPMKILGWFVRRWQMEVTFEEARAHLGVETQRQWSEKAIARATPCLLGLYSLVSLLAARLLKKQKLPARTAAWYAKRSPTFSDTIAYVRRYLWGHQQFQMSLREAEMTKVPRLLLERLTETLCYAA